jgi:hypothetical protein
MRQPPQTNEVNRAAAILAALMVAGARFGLPFELLELGSSAGSTSISPATPMIWAAWRRRTGLPGPDRADLARRAAARGGDRGGRGAGRRSDTRSTPADEATRDRLLSFVFADQPARAERLQPCTAISPSATRRGSRAPTQCPGSPSSWRCRRRRALPHVFHSMVLQYLSARGPQGGDRPDLPRRQLWLTCAPPLLARPLAGVRLDQLRMDFANAQRGAACR